MSIRSYLIFRMHCWSFPSEKKNRATTINAVLRTQAHVMHVSCVRTGILSGYEIMNIYIDMNIIHQTLYIKYF
jgi:hypothetical protein